LVTAICLTHVSEREQRRRYAERHAHDYPNYNSALALVATTPGVKDLVDNVQVDRFRDSITKRALPWQRRYSYPTLNRYAIDPAAPIRISVQNGHVELYGVVDTQADKEAAFIRANGVPESSRSRTTSR